MTLQEIFDKVATHLLAQNQKAADGYCRYRHAERKCAAGCLIADEDYSPTMEGRPLFSMLGAFETVNVAALTAVEKTTGRLDTVAKKELLRRLQNVHDTCKPDEWREQLQEVARAFGLAWT